MSASSRAQSLLRRCPSRAAQWARCAPPQRLPFAVAIVGARRWYSLGKTPAGRLGAVSRSSGDENADAPDSKTVETPGTVEETVALGATENDPSCLSSNTSAGEATSTKDPWWPEFGFAFDIDGVLLHKSDPIPGAAETLKYLQKHKIPFILLTNGGGKSEADRVAELSTKLGVDLDTTNFVQSHTPYQLLATESPTNVPLSSLPTYLEDKVGIKSLRDSTVLVLGSNASQARRIASGYGFQSVVTPGDILSAHPAMFPFDPLTEFYSKQEILPLPKPIYDPKNPDLKLEDCLKIDAILVFNDPRDWAFDIQLITDLLLSHRGYLGTYSNTNGSASLHEHKRWQSDGQPALVFSNMDLLWSTGYHLPRFGQGAFRSAVRGAFRQIMMQTEGVPRTRYRMRDFTFGKPQAPMYHFAASKLFDHFKAMWRPSSGTTDEVLRGSDDEARRLQKLSETHEASVEQRNLPNLRRVYMVGDNPESDIRGAVRWRQHLERMADSAPSDDNLPLWEACLVRTGVWNEEKMPPENLEKRGAKPDTIQNDVKAVMSWVLEKEGWPERVE